MNSAQESATAKNRGPLFVIGMWRSGTSALYALLNQHPQIALLFEGDLRLLSSRFVASQSATKLVTRWNFWNGAARRHNIEAASLPSRIRDVEEGMEATYRAFAASKGASIGGEKSPNYYDRLIQLSEEFPGARFLIIWRNPMNVCASILSARDACFWFGRKGMVLRALLGFRRMKQQVDELLRRDVPLHQIHYEELVGDTEGVMRGICRFLDIPFDPKMTSLDGADVSAIYAEEHHSGVRRESIHLKPERTYLIPADIRRKVKRYICDWKRIYGGTWPAYPCSVTGNPSGPSKVEKLLDRIGYQALWTYDRTILMVYGIAPLSLLSAYRSFKRWYHRTKENGLGGVPHWISAARAKTGAPLSPGSRGEVEGHEFRSWPP
jgi:Sulfotransferase family